MSKRFIVAGFGAFMLMAGAVAQLEGAPASEGTPGDTIVVSAEGLADPNAEEFQKDRALMIDALREDARRQVIEKAVGCYVESSTLVENFTLIEDRVLTKSKGLIKQVIKESDPWEGQDGLMHLLLKAEVFITAIGDAIGELSKEERLGLIRQGGNPRISVCVTARDFERGSVVERSQVAENILIEHFTNFGYRAWSEDLTDTTSSEETEISEGNTVKTIVSKSQVKASDFSVIGEAKFKTISAVLPPSNVTITKYVITSLTIKCVNNSTGEIVNPATEVPQKQSWADEDGALEEVGQIIAARFNKEFFEGQMLRPSTLFVVTVLGLPDYDTGVLVKKEMIGLRSILNVDFRSFDASLGSMYEVEFAGQGQDFAPIINNGVLKPLCAKVGEGAFKLTGVKGNTATVRFTQPEWQRDLTAAFNGRLPAAVAEAAPERLNSVIKSPELLTEAKEMAAAVQEEDGSGESQQNPAADF